ncbi:TetR family transcriptional regulator C-terminal domain-containing protein [Rhizobiaceae bacterium n13]|uniref:TetR family transcriptional regulator C-terminal domain-containing protein n=1 Tax=Ferirhizobium litorale TaxID=2927786 RepID=UPI0024B2CB0A|nr:TetR family transcriptional regulator C-terminal domain-containing protein [Fererhizobium litorale]MDI7863145.1 TetR family transcriptional regulator C-terminal domain-containing protein [Fererhizobium litorale]
MNRRSFHRATEAERRQDLIAATLDCIAETGLQGATVRQIAMRAGVTGGLIRHYFAGKDEMVQAAYRETMTGMTSIAIGAAEAAGGSAKNRFRSFIVANLTPPVTDSRTLSLWGAFISQIRVDPEFAAIHRENYQAFIAALEMLIGAFLKEEGRIETADDCRRHAIAINGLVDGLWLEASLAGDMFAESELPGIALGSIESILGLPAGTLSDSRINGKENI